MIIEMNPKSFIDQGRIVLLIAWAFKGYVYYLNMLEKPIGILQNSFAKNYQHGATPMSEYDLKLKPEDWVGLLTENASMILPRLSGHKIV